VAVQCASVSRTRPVLDGLLPEPRLRVGGVGTPASDVFAYVPMFSYGLPTIWISRRQVNYYSGIAVDIHGSPIGECFPRNDFRGVLRLIQTIRLHLNRRQHI
jgi:hypothetical protein